MACSFVGSIQEANRPEPVRRVSDSRLPTWRNETLRREGSVKMRRPTTCSERPAGPLRAGQGESGGERSRAEHAHGFRRVFGDTVMLIQEVTI